jgi:hypothetical protein
LAFHSGREADHSLLSSVEVKEWVELYLHSPNTPSWRRAQGEHRDRDSIQMPDVQIKSVETRSMLKTDDQLT